MGTKLCIGNSIGIGFTKSKSDGKIVKEVVYILWDDSSKILLDNNDIIIAKQKIKV